MILKDPTLVIFAKNELPSTDANMIHTLVLSAYLRAFRRVFYLSTALGVSTVLVAIFFIPQVELSKNTSEEKEQQIKSNESQTNEKNSADMNYTFISHEKALTAHFWVFIVQVVMIHR
ncbi:hypothetical protein Golomagni_04427 [Golovinomyces magnicellulatus]|nr:hypothetical protein Golomagni_04427 [Golovinomyces magnicellulatus]